MKQNKKINAKKSRCVVFAHFDKCNKIQDYVLYYLTELKKISDTIIFVSDCNIPKSELKKISKITPHYITERHGEYDFGSYKRGFFYAKERLLLENCKELIFCNDSCYGPLYPFKDMFETMKTKICDFWGATYNPRGLHKVVKKILYEKNYPHIQSFFLVFKPQVFKSEAFVDFIKNIKQEENKWYVIMNYEIGLSECLNKNGFKGAWYCQLCSSHSNAQAFHYLKLILIDKCPLVKTSIIRRKESRKEQLCGFIKKHTKYKVSLIKKDLKQNANYSEKTILKKLFFITNQRGKNNKWHKVIHILGIKFSFRDKKTI